MTLDAQMCSVRADMCLWTRRRARFGSVGRADVTSLSRFLMHKKYLVDIEIRCVDPALIVPYISQFQNWKIHLHWEVIANTEKSPKKHRIGCCWTRRRVCAYRGTPHLRVTLDAQTIWKQFCSIDFYSSSLKSSRIVMVNLLHCQFNQARLWAFNIATFGCRQISWTVNTTTACCGYKKN